MPKIYPASAVKRLNSFAEYVEQYCPQIDYKTALLLANTGEQYLKVFCLSNMQDIDSILNEAPKSMTTETIAGCILWCLIKNAYDAGMPFGKGMFCIEYEGQKSTARLYDFLRANSYTRISSHFNNFVSTHKGIDSDLSSIVWPWIFKTVNFGLCHPGKPNQFLYFKPERYGLDFVHHPVVAANHLYAWGKYLIHPQTLVGTESYRETDGRELYMLVTPKGITVRNAVEVNANKPNRASL